MSEALRKYEESFVTSLQILDNLVQKLYFEFTVASVGIKCQYVSISNKNDIPLALYEG